MTPRQRLAALLDGRIPDQPLVDIGTSTLTGLRPLHAPSRRTDLRYIDPVMHLPELTEDQLRSLGSQTRRCGPYFPGAQFDDDESFLDRDQVRWIWADGEPAPLHHPLTNASLGDIALGKRASFPGICFPSCLEDSKRAQLVIADAPSSGILDTAFRLRGYYELIDDMAERWPIANALFDWSTSAIIQDYHTMMDALPDDPDIIVYGDDLAHQSDLYLSEERFVYFLRPRISKLLSSIRSMTSAEFLFHSCGASLPILEEVAALNVRLINFEPAAKGMDVAKVRERLGPEVVFHGVIDFAALCAALRARDVAGAEEAVRTLADGWPMIVAPSDNIPASVGFTDLRAATRFFERLDLPAILQGEDRSFGEAFEDALDLIIAGDRPPEAEPAIAPGERSESLLLNRDIWDGNYGRITACLDATESVTRRASLERGARTKGQ